MQITNELEELKPEVQKQIENMNSVCQDATLPKIVQNSANNTGLSRPTYLRSQSNLNPNIQKVLHPFTTFFSSTILFHYHLFLCCSLLFASKPLLF